LSVLPMVGDPAATTIAGRGIQFASEDRGATAVMERAGFSLWGARVCGDGAGGLLSWGSWRWREADGCGDFDFYVWLCEWVADGGGAGLLRDEPGWVVLQVWGGAERQVEDSGELALGAVGMDLFAVPVGELWAAAGLCDLCSAGLLHSYD